jgi:hypothetical protein
MQGLGDQWDPKVAPAGLLELARNVRPTKLGRLAKRNGYKYGVSSVFDGSTDIGMASGIDKLIAHRGPNEVETQRFGVLFYLFF